MLDLVTLFLAVAMLITGTINTICTCVSLSSLQKNVNETILFFTKKKNVKKS